MIDQMIMLASSSQPAATNTPMPVGDALALGGSTTLIGVLIVFAALVCLIFITWLYPKISLPLIAKSTALKARRKEIKAEKQAVREATKLAKKAARKSGDSIVSVQEPVKQAAPEASAAPDGALVALITAAVAASMGVPSNGIMIRSIRRSSQSTPMWGREGRSEQVYNRF